MIFRNCQKIFLLACIIFSLSASGIDRPVSPILPITGKSTTIQALVDAEPVIQGMEEFVRTVKNGTPNILVGVYVPDVFALPVLQQPANNPGFVSTQQNSVTQFAAASQFGTKGLLAHNYLSGAQFFQIELNKVFYLIYGDGSTKSYIVSAIKRYQALQPDSPTSNFVDLQNPGAVISAADLFSRIYARKDQVVFQTCIEKDGNSSWGRIFVIAAPYSIPEMSFHWSNAMHSLPASFSVSNPGNDLNAYGKGLFLK